MTNPAAAEINRDLENESPALHTALSELGRDSVFPPDIPFQAAQAKGKRYNGTIGIFTDGHGHAVPLPSMAGAVHFEGEDLDAAFLYSPASGLPEMRRRWREWQRRSIAEVGREPGDVPSSLPVVTMGLAHSLSTVADLFAGPGRVVAVPTPFWGNYRQTFTLRRGAEIRSASTYVVDRKTTDRRYHPRVFEDILGDLPDGEPALAIVNFPSNPGGYTPTTDERRELIASLVRIAEKRPLLVLCDDAYAGLVYAEDVPAASIFWDLAGLHPNLAPIKIDGATKEFAFFGGRVGFLTFALDPESKAAASLESKIKCLSRATIGSPGAAAQMILLQALRQDPDALDKEIGAVRRIARQRYDAIKPALDALDRDLLKPLPFNSGFFALLELPEGVDADAVRLHLLEHHDTGVVSVRDRHLRIATCSVDAADLPEMVRRVEQGVREMVAKG